MTSRKPTVISPTPVDEPSLETLDHELRAACMRIARKVRHEASTLPPHFATVLAKLAVRERTAAELAQLELVSAPSMSRTICELEDAGYLRRTPHPDDKRKQLCQLTDAGAKVLEETRTTRDTWMADRLAELTADERALLLQATVLLNRAATR